MGKIAGALGPFNPACHRSGALVKNMFFKLFGGSQKKEVLKLISPNFRMFKFHFFFVHFSCDCYLKVSESVEFLTKQKIQFLRQCPNIESSDTVPILNKAKLSQY